MPSVDPSALSEPPPSAIERAEGDVEGQSPEGDDEGVAGQLGAQRYVMAGFFVTGIALAYVLGKSVAAIWGKLAEAPWFQKSVTFMARVGEEERAEYATVLGGIVAIVVTLYAYRRADVRQWTDEVASELSKVTWPDKAEVTNSTVVVIVTSALATVYLALLDRFWGFVTNLVYGGSLRAKRNDHEQEVVRHPDLLGLREQGEGLPPGACEAAQHGGEVRRDPDSDRVGAEHARGREDVDPHEDQLARLHLRRDGDERARLAPRQGHSEGDRVHRQPDADAGQTARDRRAPQGHRRRRGQAEGEGLVRARRRGPCRRRRVRQLQRRRRRGQAREAEAQGQGLDLRPRDPGRARVLTGREAISRPTRSNAITTNHPLLVPLVGANRRAR